MKKLAKWELDMDRLASENLSAWRTMHMKVWDKLSDAQTMFCCCGRLATGLHENRCGRFREKVNKETVRRLLAE